MIPVSSVSSSWWWWGVSYKDRSTQIWFAWVGLLLKLVDVRRNDKLVGVKTPRIFDVVDLLEEGGGFGEVCWVIMQPVYARNMSRSGRLSMSSRLQSSM